MGAGLSRSSRTSCLATDRRCGSRADWRHRRGDLAGTYSGWPQRCWSWCIVAMPPTGADDVRLTDVIEAGHALDIHAMVLGPAPGASEARVETDGTTYDGGEHQASTAPVRSTCRLLLLRKCSERSSKPPPQLTRWLSRKPSSKRCHLCGAQPGPESPSPRDSQSSQCGSKSSTASAWWSTAATSAVAFARAFGRCCPTSR